VFSCAAGFLTTTTTGRSRGRQRQPGQWRVNSGAARPTPRQPGGRRGYSTRDGTRPPSGRLVCLYPGGKESGSFASRAPTERRGARRVAGRFKTSATCHCCCTRRLWGGVDLTGWDLRERHRRCRTTGLGHRGGWGGARRDGRGFSSTTIQGFPDKGSVQPPAVVWSARSTLPGRLQRRMARARNTVARACCPKPFSDGDQDGDVDVEDFAIFQGCINTGRPSSIAAGCQCWDINSDGLIDGDSDFARAFTSAVGKGSTRRTIANKAGGA